MVKFIKSKKDKKGRIISHQANRPKNVNIVDLATYLSSIGKDIWGM